MSERKEEQWYTNKDLFEMVQSLKVDLAQTRTDIRQYNNLRGQIADLQEMAKQWAEHIALHGGRRSAADGIRVWGGWIMSAILFGINLINFFWK